MVHLVDISLAIWQQAKIDKHLHSLADWPKIAKLISTIPP